MKTVLISGAHGFLGRHTARLFGAKGYRVIGIGHGDWGLEKPADFGIERWIEADVDFAALANIDEQLDYIIHCAGGSSVGHSVQFPEQDFYRTVGTIIAVLEYARLRQPGARIIYPSSAAVYGAKDDSPITVDDELAPLSPYGFHKKIVEDLCTSYSINYGINISIIRFFSIYGPGLQKQLLWDACAKLCGPEVRKGFYGTGDETRDWLHVSDAAELLFRMSQNNSNFEIVNGGSGDTLKISEIISRLADLLGTKADIVFTGEQKKGDPQHYWADISEVSAIGWQPEITIDQGLREYVEWFKSHG